jgi:hypothetical protein
LSPVLENVEEAADRVGCHTRPLGRERVVGGEREQVVRVATELERRVVEQPVADDRPPHDPPRLWRVNGFVDAAELIWSASSSRR